MYDIFITGKCLDIYQVTTPREIIELTKFHAIRKQNPLVSPRFFIAYKHYITLNGKEG